ncbi:MarR family transcriptional regulator [Sphingobium sp. Ant17]|nr:MarR family transcriptional regulator [Sphingobium sp. Ant17]
MDEDLASVERRLTTGLVVLGRRYSQLLDRLVDQYGLSGASALPIALLSRMGDGTRQGSLAGALNVEGPALVRQLDRLCASGLVERVEDSTDRRSKTLHLTQQGWELAAKIEATLSKTRHILLAGVPSEDLDAALRVFCLLEERMGQMVPIGSPDDG